MEVINHPTDRLLVADCPNRLHTVPCRRCGGIPPDYCLDESTEAADGDTEEEATDVATEGSEAPSDSPSPVKRTRRKAVAQPAD